MKYKIGIGRHRFKPQFNLLENESLILQGSAYWAKIVGDPQPGYDKTQKEWSMDLGNLTEKNIATLKEAGLGHKVKNKGDDRGDFIQFKRKALKKDQATGAMVPSKPIEIVDKDKNPWDGKTKIGNGSTVNVKFLVNETTYNGKKFLKPGIIGVQVVKHVPWEGGDHEDFPEYNEDGTETWDTDED